MLSSADGIVSPSTALEPVTQCGGQHTTRRSRQTHTHTLLWILYEWEINSEAKNSGKGYLTLVSGHPQSITENSDTKTASSWGHFCKSKEKSLELQWFRATPRKETQSQNLRARIIIHLWWNDEEINFLEVGKWWERRWLGGRKHPWDIQGRFGVAIIMWIKTQPFLHIDTSMTSRVWDLWAERNPLHQSLETGMVIFIFCVPGIWCFSKQTPSKVMTKPPVINGLYPNFYCHNHHQLPDF